MALVNFDEVKKNQADEDPDQRVENQYPQEVGPELLPIFTLLLLTIPRGFMIRHAGSPADGFSPPSGPVSFAGV